MMYGQKKHKFNKGVKFWASRWNPKAFSFLEHIYDS